ncbi:MAG: DNA ligase D, partial [Gemmataceae bacterium]
ATAKDLYRRLQPLRIAGRPYTTPLPAAEARGLLYVRPELVAEVEFATWTADRRVRHAAWRGLREDKPAGAILRDEEGTAVLPRARSSRPRLTHPERVYWPDADITKKDLADYHAAVWPRMVRFVAGRPLALKRCPEGIDHPCFFQKHPWKGMSPAIRVTPDPADPGQQLLGVDDLDGVLGLVQGGALELHPWGARLDDLERPDFLTFDLDPGEDTGWPQVVEAAHEVRQRVETAGLAAFVKTSGGKGLHVVVPIVPKARWPVAKAWAKRLATAIAQDRPDRYVATMSKARRRGRIFIDWLRNARGTTAVAPWSPRARPGAPVSMPIAWDELDQGIGPASFTLEDSVRRTTDPWAGFSDAARPLPSGRKS